MGLRVGSDWTTRYPPAEQCSTRLQPVKGNLEPVELLKQQVEKDTGRKNGHSAQTIGSSGSYHICT